MKRKRARERLREQIMPHRQFRHLTFTRPSAVKHPLKAIGHSPKVLNPTASIRQR
jgi:hypothetical protein